MIRTRARLVGGGGGGHVPPKMFDKHGVIWRILSVPKYVIMNLKINNFKDNKSTTTENVCHTLLSSSCVCLCDSKYIVCQN